MAPAYRVLFTLRFTRYSCAPWRASKSFDRFVQAADPPDAVRQACLCLDQELEQILAQINAINVSEVYVDISRVTPTERSADEPLWNSSRFDPSLEIPQYIVVRGGPGQ